jgi:hypothetical protein
MSAAFEYPGSIVADGRDFRPRRATDVETTLWDLAAHPRSVVERQRLVV